MCVLYIKSLHRGLFETLCLGALQVADVVEQHHDGRLLVVVLLENDERLLVQAFRDADGRDVWHIVRYIYKLCRVSALVYLLGKVTTCSKVYRKYTLLNIQVNIDVSSPAPAPPRAVLLSTEPPPQGLRLCRICIYAY